MNDKTNDTRQHILDVGYQLIVSRGFTSVGLSQLLTEANVPKGSFYHYFKSKEQFGEALIKHYFESYIARVEALLFDGEGNHYQRLMHYFSLWMQSENNTCNAHKCLVVKLSAEVSDLSVPMRNALLNGANTITDALARCIDAGQKEGSISGSHAQQTAQTVYAQWLGASLLSKLSNDTHSLKMAYADTERQLSSNG